MTRDEMIEYVNQAELTCMRQRAEISAHEAAFQSRMEAYRAAIQIISADFGVSLMMLFFAAIQSKERPK